HWEELLLEKIHKRKNQDPDKIDKMPIETGNLHMFRLVPATGNRRQNATVINHAAGYVHAVKTGEDEKRGGKKARGERKTSLGQTLGDQVRPFISLAPQKEQAA